MGYGGSEPSEEVLGMIAGILSDLTTICEPEYGYTVYEGTRSGTELVRIADSDLTTGPVIASCFRDAEYVAAFVATIGEGFDLYSKRLQNQGDMARAFLADSIGSVLAEGCVALMINALEKDMNTRGLQISNNYSPGYCGWPLVEQGILFSHMVDGTSCNVKLTPSFLMIPIKSVSGIIGASENMKKRAYGCDICTMTTCIKYRKRREAGA